MKTKLLKKIFCVLIAGTAVFCLAACSGGTESETAVSDQAEEGADSQDTRIRQKLHPMPDSQKVRRTAQKTLPEKAMLLLRISHGREIQRP